LNYSTSGSILARMKTTIDIDEEKLKRIMELTGIKTRKEAVDYALAEVERLARIRQLLDRPFYLETEGDVLDPAYDLMKLRELEKPG
jgi:Arc/MetJ family transcription regulator